MTVKIINFCWFGMVAVLAAYCGKFRCSNMKGLAVGVEICEDVWIPAPPLQRNFAVVNAVFMFHFSFRYNVVLYSGIRWCPQYTA